MAFYSLVRQLWVKTLLVLLPRRFHVVRLLFLALGFPFRALLLVKFHGFRTREFGLCIGLLRQNDQSQDVVERRTDKIDRILLIVPRGDGLLICFISRVRRRIDLRRRNRSEEHTSELQSRLHLVCRLLLEKKKQPAIITVASDASETLS